MKQGTELTNHGRDIMNQSLCNNADLYLSWLVFTYFLKSD